jgi:hypothetical protein
MHRVAVSVVLVRLAVTVKLLGEVGDPACDCLLRLLEALLNVLADLRQVVCSELVVTCGDCRTGRTIEEAVLSVGFVGPLPRLLPPLAMATLALARGTALALKLGSDMLSSALKAGSTLPPLATSTALTTLLSISGKASISVFCACCCGDMGRGGLGGGISVASSLKRTPGLGDLGGGGDATVSWVAAVVGASLSSSKSSSRAVVGLSGG